MCRIDVNLATQSANDSTHIQSVALSNWRRLDTSEFEMSPNEIKSLEELQDTLCMYELTKQVFNHDEKQDKYVVLVDLHQFMILWQSSQSEKS